MLVGRISASDQSGHRTAHELERMRVPGTAEINRLEKLQVKAEQRLSARYRDLIRARAHVRRLRPASALQSNESEAVADAQLAWDQAADERLGIVVRLLSVRRLLSKTHSENVGATGPGTRQSRETE